MAGISHSGDDDLVITGPLDISDHSGSSGGSGYRYPGSDDSDTASSGHANNGVIGNNVTITGTVAMGHHNNVRGH